MKVKIVGASLAILILIVGVTWYGFSTNSKIENLQSRQTRLQGELTSTQTKLESTRDDLSSAKIEISSTKLELTSTKTDLASTKQSLSLTQDRLVGTQEDLFSTQTDLVATKGDLASTQTDLSKTREELSTTATSLSSTQKDLTTTQQNLSATRNSLETTKSNLSVTSSDLESTRNDLSSTKQSLSQTQSSLKTAERDLSSAQEDLSKTRLDLNSQLAGLESEVSSLGSQVSILEDELSSLDTQLNPPPASLADYPNGSWLERNHGDIASKIGALDWVRDGTSALEESAVKELLYTAVDSPEAVRDLANYSWILDGIVQSERDALDYLNYSRDREVIQKTVRLPWVRDGITPLESRTLQELGWLTYSKDESELPIQAALALLSKQWILDGIDPLEADIVVRLRSLSYRTWQEPNRPLSIESQKVLSIFSMPFLETVEAHDLHVIQALASLAYDLDHFEQVLLHDSLEEGITDKLAPIIATLRGVAVKDPSFIDVLLGSGVTLENSTVSTMMSKRVEVTIVRVGSRGSTSLTTLSQTIQEIEEYVGTALPTKHVILLYDPSYSDEWAAGTYYTTHIAARPKYDKGDSGFNPKLIAHEVAHYYFNSGNSDYAWIYEGLADTLQILIPRERSRSRSGVSAQNSRQECTLKNIKSLEAQEIDQGSDEFWCNYYLGEKLFVDIYNALGEIEFRRALRTLYQLSRQEDLDISHIREVFGTSPRIERIINRHYNGS